MKKVITNLLATALIAFAIPSCQDALDIMQDGILTNESTFQTVEDLRQFLIEIGRAHV